MITGTVRRLRRNVLIGWSSGTFPSFVVGLIARFANANDALQSSSTAAVRSRVEGLFKSCLKMMFAAKDLLVGGFESAPPPGTRPEVRRSDFVWL